MSRKQLLTLGLAMAIVGASIVGVTTATSSYIHEKTVNGIGTISICDPDNSMSCITIMDRNLGATKAGVICSYQDTGACGAHFQWGNSHGFLSCGIDGCDDFLNGETLVEYNIANVNGSNYGPGNYYDSNIFITNTSGSNNGDWSISGNNNLWGGSDDNIVANNWGYDEGNHEVLNALGRKGPCPVGYHVPSIGEWSKLVDYRGQNFIANGHELNLYGYTGTDLKDFMKVNGESIDGSMLFQSDFKIPFAGNRYNGTVYGVNEYGYFWSSSPTSLYYSRSFLLDTGTASSNYYEYRGNGLSVRCFKNASLSFPLIEPTDTDIQLTVGQTVYDGLPNTMTVTTNNVQQVNNKPVLGEVSVSFGENTSAKFSKLVKVNVPVDSAEQVIIKVKHAGSDEYNFDGLTTNANASCNNGTPTSSQYNGTPITVVDGFASIYTCEASSFIALDVPPVEAQINLSVIKGTLTIGTETGNLNLGEVNVSNNAQELSGSFGVNSFWVEDMKGAESGYYTTISVTDLTGSVAGHIISADNVSLKTAGNEPSNISGATASDAKVIFGEGIKSWHSGSGQVNYFQRLNTASQDAGRVGKWGDNLQIKVNIPAHTPYDTYRGTITYTLYDLDS